MVKKPVSVSNLSALTIPAWKEKRPARILVSEAGPMDMHQDEMVLLVEWLRGRTHLHHVLEIGSRLPLLWSGLATGNVVSLCPISEDDAGLEQIKTQGIDLLFLHRASREDYDVYEPFVNMGGVIVFTGIDDADHFMWSLPTHTITWKLNHPGGGIGVIIKAQPRV